jgi:hypothetical protein
MVSKATWVDPPDGWRHGFPKIYDSTKDGELYEWLVAQGYPQSEIEALGESFFIRCWEPTKEERSEYNERANLKGDINGQG